MNIEELFIRASQEFEDRDYEKGILLISRCIDKDQENSQLYCNRGLFFAQLGENDSAKKDLEKAILLNHLNYLAYFNLFSLQFRSGEDEKAFENLCCSLSCLYLVRAKKSRRELDVQKSIIYADNNVEAYVLKSLMYLEEGKTSLAQNNIEWACDLNPNSLLCLKLKNIISKKVDPYSPEEPIHPEMKSFKSPRLRSSYKVEKETLELQVRQKVNEFNQIYDGLLGEEGAITQKVPRIIAPSKYEPQKKESLLLEEQNLLDEIVATPNKVDVNAEVKDVEIRLPPSPPSPKKDSPIPTRASLEKKNTRSISSSSKKGTASNSKVSEMSSNSQSVSLYPIREKKKIQFTIVSADIKHPGNLKDFYITGNYNSRKGQRIRTAIKKIEGANCAWYASNPPTLISQTVQTLSVKLYAKQYFSVNDELIGDGEVEVLRSGQIKIPVYYKAKSTAFVVVRVDLI